MKYWRITTDGKMNRIKVLHGYMQRTTKVLISAKCFSLRCRHRKDELERRMSALQESRRELMVQLEGLMRLLKVEDITNIREYSLCHR